MISSVNRAALPAATPASSSGRQANFGKSIPYKFRGAVQSQTAAASTAGKTSTKAATNSTASQKAVTAAAALLSTATSAHVATAAATATPAVAADATGNSPKISGAISSVTLDGLNKLTAALQAAGIDPNSLSMVAHDDQVYYPGSSWTNYEITLNANGHTESFAANLVVLNPNVAVTEIKHLLALG